MVKRMGRVLAKDALFILATVILVILISLLFKGTVHSMPKSSQADSMEKYYISLEKEYVSNVKMNLAKAGYNNAGVISYICNITLISFLTLFRRHII